VIWGDKLTSKLRVGHIPLNGYLHKIKRVAIAACPACGHPNETPQHYIMECPAYERERAKLIERKEASEERYAKIISEEKKLYALAIYIKETARFEAEEGKEGSKRDGAEAQVDVP